MFRITLAVIALASAASGHLTISKPQPIPNQIKDPIVADTWPCHGQALTGSGGAPMAAGSSQTLEFDAGPDGFNTAVHGGGSCQISITYETDPEKIKDPASWRVLKSIEEGCPTNSKGNLDVSLDGGDFIGPNGVHYSGALYCDDPKSNGVDCINTFDFDIPKDLPSGQATIAWTWFNNVGNREMYMNCAAANIQGGSSNTDFLNSLPEIFTANIGNDCATTENFNTRFPNPGSVLEEKKATPKEGCTGDFAPYPFKDPVGSECGASGGSTPPTTTSVVSQPPPPTYAPSSSNTGGVFAPGGGQTSTSFTTQISTVVASTPTYSPPQGTGAPTGGCQYPCSNDGGVVCMPNNMWGLCNHGCVVPQGMAAGMKCENGQMEAINRRHPHGFAHRRSF